MTSGQQITAEDGTRIAFHKIDGSSPGVVFCGGFKSDMTGTKALALEDHCRQAGRAYLRFDYRGHGASGGRFEDATIGTWRDDTLDVLDRATRGPQVLVGSSMGGWIALLAALARPDRVAGLVTIAAAPDFTETLMWADFDAATRERLMRDGVLRLPSDYDDEPYVITRALIEEGRQHLLLDAPIPISCPARLLHGMDDQDVPWRHGLKLAECLDSPDVTLTLTKNGDHRLSSPADIARLTATVERLCQQLEDGG